MCGGDIWVCLQEPEAILPVFHVLARKALTPPGNQEADALAWVQSLATDPSADTADWMHGKSGHHRAWVGWHIAKDVGLPLKYSDLVNAITACLCVLNNAHGNCQRSLRPPTRVPNW